MLPVRERSRRPRRTIGALGFDREGVSRKPPAPKTPSTAFSTRDGLHLHLMRVTDLDRDRNTSGAYFYVDDADALYARLEGRGRGRPLPPDA